MTAVWLAALAAGVAVWSWRNPAARLRPTGPSRSLVPRLGQRLGLTLATAASALLLLPSLGGWGWVACLGLGAVTFWTTGQLATAAETRRSAALTDALPQLCDLLAVCLDSGLPLRSAIAAITPVLDDPLRAVLAHVASKVALGIDEATAWAELGRAEPALAGLAAEFAQALDSGLALAKTVRGFGVEARREALAQQEYRARRVGVRSVLPLMVCFLPAFLLLGIVPIVGGVIGRLF